MKIQPSHIYIALLPAFFLIMGETPALFKIMLSFPTVSPPQRVKRNEMRKFGKTPTHRGTFPQNILMWWFEVKLVR